MSGHDEELERLRAAVNCATVLERLVPGWTLDKAESTRNALKYRRGAGEIVIVNHQGRGWWDPQSDARGDVFNLAQHLDPSLNFGHVRKALRGLAGVAPAYPAVNRHASGTPPVVVTKTLRFLVKVTLCPGPDRRRSGPPTNSLFVPHRPTGSRQSQSATVMLERPEDFGQHMDESCPGHAVPGLAFVELLPDFAGLSDGRLDPDRFRSLVDPAAEQLLTGPAGRPPVATPRRRRAAV